MRRARVNLRVQESVRRPFYFGGRGLIIQYQLGATTLNYEAPPTLLSWDTWWRFASVEIIIVGWFFCENNRNDDGLCIVKSDLNCKNQPKATDLSDLFQPIGKKRSFYLSSYHDPAHPRLAHIYSQSIFACLPIATDLRYPFTTHARCPFTFRRVSLGHPPRY